jgi:hypothetical protein
MQGEMGFRPAVSAEKNILERLRQGVSDFGIRLYLFCLMSNHYHLVLETPKANLSWFMQSLSTARNSGSA